ncbi:hypothetical protein EWM64_g2426 [Hericium alpestre]|uniref:Helicase C-terminal domain-containing protein n=1 Tax=Hericium alpestre TaxID=135208 RepID=A0A4Z0A4F2_9AGAM|nr:hypothetical protein EWM64_g2426 [Hericium alpestre]
MLTLDKPYDVLVVDEIQMLDDSERGFAWTSAVLGAAAHELHLCGEEAAVPLVQSLLELTGDELVVNRYERLSPLGVADRSLESDLTQVQKGDCVVAFSRSRIFALKREIEKTTGLRCALVYGRLPPEIRSEQAALFNDPDSGYDVLVGSDAIGMGLNLKIRRVVFDALGKFDGIRDRPLSTSQVKQIAGRAGRFGLHANTREPGIVTTLHEQDIPFLRTALAAPVTYLAYARVGWIKGTPLQAEQLNSAFDVKAPVLPRSALDDIAKQVVMQRLPDATPEEMLQAEEETKRVLSNINARRIIQKDHINLHSLEEEELAGYSVRLQRGSLGLEKQVVEAAA